MQVSKCYCPLEPLNNRPALTSTRQQDLDATLQFTGISASWYTSAYQNLTFNLEHKPLIRSHTTTPNKIEMPLNQCYSTAKAIALYM